MRHLLIIILCYLTNISFGQVALDNLPDQVIGRGGTFNDVSLNGFTTSSVFWEVNFLKPEVQDVKPTWTVNSSDFQFEMNITASVVSKATKAVGDSHILAVTDVDGVVRSVGTAIQVQDDWVYFLTVYANSNDEELFFTFFDDSISQILKGKEAFQFESNRVLGEPDNPFIINAVNISFNLDSDLLSFKIEDQCFLGLENILVTARNLDNPNDFATDTITLTVSDDYTPKLENIPNQVINFGENFTDFDLDDHTTLKDSDLLAFSFSGNTELQISINVDNVVSITRPDNWSGNEDITFTVTDQTDNAFGSSNTVSFTGKPEDQAPVITSMSDQTTGVGGFFETILLNDFVTATNIEAVKWDFEFLTDSIVNSPDWAVNTNEFQFDMSVTAEVTSLGKRLSGQSHILAAFSATEKKVVGKTEAIEVNGDWFFFLTINSNTDQDSIYFKVFDDASKRVLPTNSHIFFEANKISGDPLDPFSIDAGYLFPKMDGEELSFTLRDVIWDGTEIIKLTATDTTTVQQLSDSDTINFAVLNIKPPVLEGISNQTIEEGSSFSAINLADFLKNLTFDEVSVAITGADTLSPVLTESIISFSIPDTDFFGEEFVEIKVTSLENQDLVDLVKVSLKVNNVNDAPVITSTPPAKASIGNLYQYDFLATDVDFDVLTISASNVPSWLFFVPNANGAIILGVPSAEDAGNYSITVEVSDGQKIVQQEIAVVVSLARIENISSQVIDEGASFSTIDLDDFLTKFGDITTYWEAMNGNELIVSLDTENTLSIQSPDENWFGKEQITIKLIDQSDNSLLDEVNLDYEITNINDAPEFLSNPSADIVAENQIHIKTLVQDVDGDALIFSMLGAPDWLTLLSESDGFTLFGQPELVAQTYDFEVTANDGTIEVNLSIQLVISYDIPPMASITAINVQMIDEGASFNTIDLDDYLTIVGQISTYWEVTAGTELTIDLDSENILSIVAPNENWFGKEDVKVRLKNQADDTLLDEITIVYEVLNINDVPEFLSNPSGEFVAKDLLQVKTLVQDIDKDPLTFSLVGAPNWITLLSETDGFTLFGQPELAAQTYNFEVIADDGTTQSTLNVQIVTSYILSIDEVNSNIMIYPNPSFDKLNIQSRILIEEIKVLDHAGKQIMSFLGHKKVIDVSTLKKGFYFLRLNNKETFRFMKQ